MTAQEKDAVIHNHFKKLGRKGGRVMTPRKLAALKRNAKLPRKKKEGV